MTCVFISKSIWIRMVIQCWRLWLIRQLFENNSFLFSRSFWNHIPISYFVNSSLAKVELYWNGLYLLVDSLPFLKVSHFLVWRYTILSAISVQVGVFLNYVHFIFMFLYFSLWYLFAFCLDSFMSTLLQWTICITMNFCKVKLYKLIVKSPQGFVLEPRRFGQFGLELKDFGLWSFWNLGFCWSIIFAHALFGCQT